MQQVNIGGKTLYLNVRAGTFEVTDEANKPMALMGFTYYSKGDKRGSATRRGVASAAPP